MRRNAGGSKHPDISVFELRTVELYQPMQVEAITFLLNAVEEFTLQVF